MSTAGLAPPVGASDEDDVLRDAESDSWSDRFDEFAMGEGAEEAARLRLAQLRADAEVSVTTIAVPGGGTIVWWSTSASADRPGERSGCVANPIREAGLDVPMQLPLLERDTPSVQDAAHR